MTQFQSTLWTLIHSAREGEEKAFEDFFLKYRSPVVAFCVRKGMGQEAEDLAQEVFTRIFRDGVLAKADPSKGRFRSLILVVTKNVIGNHLERVRAKKRGGGQVQQLGEIDVADSVEEETFDREWVSHLIESSLERLSLSNKNYYEALRRFLLEEESYAIIAPAMGKSEGEIKNYIHRGKAKLVQFLQEEVRDYSTSHGEYEDELRHLSKYLPSS